MPQALLGSGTSPADKHEPSKHLTGNGLTCGSARREPQEHHDVVVLCRLLHRLARWAAGAERCRTQAIASKEECESAIDGQDFQDYNNMKETSWLRSSQPPIMHALPPASRPSRQPFVPHIARKPRLRDDGLRSFMRLRCFHPTLPLAASLY
jgi:hypothetical protein